MFFRREITVTANNAVWKKVSFSNEKGNIILANSHLPFIPDTPPSSCVEYQKLSFIWFWESNVKWMNLSFHDGEASPYQRAKRSVRFNIFCLSLMLRFCFRLSDWGSWRYSNTLFISWSLLISPGCCCNSTISLYKLIRTEDLLNMKTQKPGYTHDSDKAAVVGGYSLFFPSVGETVTRTFAIVARKSGFLWYKVIFLNRKHMAGP